MRVSRRDDPDYCPPQNPPRFKRPDAAEHLERVETGRWYFTTIEQRQMWLRERYRAARDAGAPSSVLYTLRKAALG
jgi:hypothetical protein